jgi:hypothetical protein
VTIGITKSESLIEVAHAGTRGPLYQFPNSDPKNPFSALRAAMVSLPSPIGFK